MTDRSGNWQAIGVIHSPHLQSRGTPIQPRFAEGFHGRVELDPRYQDTLTDLEGFERIWLIYLFDRASEMKLVVTPYLDDQPHGVFATRAPARPNYIGMSCVRLLRIEGTFLHIGEIDVLDGTPLIDIKPYVPPYDCYPESRFGWMKEKEMQWPRGRADSRFER